MQIILGSKSPRRRELLSQCGYDFLVDAIDVDEEVTCYNGPSDYVNILAKKKGEAVYLHHPNDLVICADTVVSVEGMILGKPNNKTEAQTMIKLISGKAHDVYTGVYLRFQNHTKVFVVKTKVFIDYISEEDIIAYINTKEPYDKAGGYAIQGYFGKFVKKIQGDYYNVMGLPINRLHKEIQKILKNKPLKI
jgi:septum formation protein